MPDRYSSQHQVRAYFTEFPGIYFTGIEGGAAVNEVTDQFPGGSPVPEQVTGPTTIEQVTLTKPFEPIADEPLQIWVRAWDAGARKRLTLVKEYITSEGVPVGKQTRFMECAKVSYKDPDFNRGSAEVANITLIVKPRYIA